MGIPLNDIPGETLGLKEQNLKKMPIQQYLSIVDASGFTYKATPGSLHVIPGRFAVTVIGTGPAITHGMHWFVLGGKSNTEYMKRFCESFVAESSGLAESCIQKQFIDLAKARLTA